MFFFFLLFIDPVINQYNGTATAVPEDQILSEPVLKKCKEENSEYDVDFGMEQKTSSTQTDVGMDDIKVVVIGEVDIETSSTSTSTTSSEEMTAEECEDSSSETSSVISKESSSATKVRPQNSV